ncbi:MAG: hypothetical protein KF859_10055 [Phycisphaeraceae bacterium]|nr:hypothetical protein [Phycisphaeraceae bacterium]
MERTAAIPDPDPPRPGGLSGDAIIAPEGLILAVCDADSTMNRCTMNKEAWASTVPGSDARLWDYNTHLARLAADHLGLAWMLVLWGVYRVGLRMHAAPHCLPPSTIPPLLAADRDLRLNCPSGRLVLLDVECMETCPPVPLAVIAPGRYRAAFVDHGTEQDHWELADAAEYPPEHGPDWMLHLAPDPAEITPS